jgi:hypothetical protein
MAPQPVEGWEATVGPPSDRGGGVCRTRVPDERDDARALDQIGCLKRPANTSWEAGANDGMIGVISAPSATRLAPRWSDPTSP